MRCEKIHSGPMSVALLLPREIAESGISLQASYFVLAHNHPDGETKPSKSDLETTRMLRSVFSKLQMPLAEHFVYAEGHCYPMIRHAGEKEK